MKEAVLRILQESRDYVSGQRLSGLLGVSRAAVWKAIKGLEEDGYVIDAVRNRGYLLKEEPDILTRESCASCIHTRWLGQRLAVYGETDSTNTRLKLMGEEGAPTGTVAVADLQNAGKGRLGRSWSAPAGSALTFSVLLRPDIPPANASMLTLVAALAVSSALDSIAGIQTQIKWPNDIVYEGKKLVGILTEMSADMDAIHYVVVGIGINTGIEAFPEELRERATSLKLETGKQFLRSRVLGEVLQEFEQYYERFLEDGDMRELKVDYEGKLANLGNQVCVLAPEGEWRGQCQGLGDDGSLLVRRADGSVEAVISGEVSVRGIYGYV